MNVQAFIELKEKITALKKRIDDTSITVAQLNEFREELQETKKALHALAGKGVAELFKLKEQNPSILAGLHVPYGFNGYGIVSVKISHSKQAIKVLMSRTFEFEPQYAMMLLPFDFIDNREVYIARREEFLSGRKVLALRNKQKEIAEKIANLSADLAEVDSKEAIAADQHFNKYDTDIETAVKELKY